MDWLTGKKGQSRMIPRILELEIRDHLEHILLIGEELILNEGFFFFFGGAEGVMGVCVKKIG